MKPFIPAVAGLLLAGCAAEPPPSPVAGLSPADPSASIRPARYAPVTAGSADYRPVDPKPWGEQNKAVTSKPMGGM